MFYILNNDNEIVEIEDILRWGGWFELSDRRVGLTTVGEYRVSTAFLGINYRFMGDGPPLLFETMIFLDSQVEGELPHVLKYQERYATYAEAQDGHVRAVKRLETALELLTQQGKEHEKADSLSDSGEFNFLVVGYPLPVRLVDGLRYPHWRLVNDSRIDFVSVGEDNGQTVTTEPNGEPPQAETGTLTIAADNGVAVRVWDTEPGNFRIDAPETGDVDGLTN